MFINFGSSVTKCSIIFDPNANFRFVNSWEKRHFGVQGNNWNGRVSFPNNIYSMRVNNSKQLNKKVTFLYNSTNNYTFIDAFMGCSKFNQPFTFPPRVSNMYNAFRGCSALKANIQMPTEFGGEMSNVFQGCTQFNQNVAFPIQGGSNLTNTFTLCRMFNQPLEIPDYVTSMTMTFTGCNNLNANIKISNNCKILNGTFSNCINLNQNIKIPQSVTNMDYTFWRCFNLNQNIQIPNNVTNIRSAFNVCPNLNHNLFIPNSVTDMTMAFQDCSRLSNLTFAPGIANNVAYNAIRDNATQSLNIWTDPTTAANLMTTALIQRVSSPLTYETITNGYYNSQYNLYIYTNAFS